MSKTVITKPESKLILIKNYTFASINLYGVIKLEDFLSVLSHYEGEQVPREEVISVLELLTSISEIGISFRQNIIGNEYFFLADAKEFKEAKELLKSQERKPRYLPSREEFLRYADRDYVEPRQPLYELEKFFFENDLNPGRNEEDIQLDVLEFHDMVVFGEPLPEYIEYLEQTGYSFTDDVQIKEFGDLVKIIHDQTRMYEYNGFTPSEIEEIFDTKSTLIQ
jgi:hypothetical protein